MYSIIKTARVLCFSVLSICSAVPSFAGIINGDFNQGLDSWVDVSGSGSVGINSGAATLATGAGTDAFSAVLVQGDDGNFSFLTPIALSPLTKTFEFDFWLISKQIDASETGSSLFVDALTLSFYDDTNSQFDLSFPVINVGSVPTRGSFDISTLAGRNIILSFELADEDDGFDVVLGIDNLAIIEQNPSVNVPDSSALVLLLIGLLGLGAIRRKA